MIDTDKYKGHTEGKWDITVDIAMEGSYFFRQGYDREQEGCDDDECDANARLMSDAPLLLAEVKRLRELFSIDEGSRDEGYCVTMRLEGCEYIGTLRLYKDEEGKVIE